MRRLLVLFIFSPFTVLCQLQNFTFHHLTMATGLSSNHVNRIIQDKEGFYWIATNDGLTRFDGSACTIYCNRKNYQYSLSNNNCIFLLEDDIATIWVATQYGLNRLNKKTNQFEAFYLERSSATADKVNWIRGLAKDNKGNIYISSAGLWQYNIYSHKWKTFLHNENNVSSPPRGLLSSLQYDSLHHGLWMCGEKGYAFFDETDSKFYYADYNPRHLEICTRPNDGDAIALDEKMRLWFRDNKTNFLCYYDTRLNTISSTTYKIPDHLYKLSVDREQKVWIHYLNSSTIVYDPGTNTASDLYLKYHHPHSALDSVSTDLYVDKQNNYWVSGNKGVSIFNPLMQSIHYFILPGNNKNIQPQINGIAEQSDGLIWVGTSDGLYQFSFTDGKFKKTSFSYPVSCLSFIDNNIIWAGVKNEIWEFDLLQRKVIRKLAVNANVDFIKPGQQNEVWIGTLGDGLYEFAKDGRPLQQFQQGESSKDLTGNKPIGISDIYGDHFWIGYTDKKGFAKFNTASKSWDRYVVSVNNAQHSPYNTVSCILELDKQTIWLGTSGGGMVHYNPEDKKFELFTESDGLKSSRINSLLLDDSVMLWVSTNGGLTVIDTKTKQLMTPDVDLTPSNDEFVSNGIKLKNHHLLFFAGNTLAEINAGLFFHQPPGTKILITSLKVFNKEIIPEKVNKNGTELQHDENFFSFEYSLLSTLSSIAPRYAYMLEGFDKEWNEVNERRVAYYTNVPAGNYTFRVKATDATGRWKYFSEAFIITIQPPFWQRIWFIVLCIILFSFALYTLYRYRIRQIKKVYKLRSDISKDLHDEVASTLSGIRLYSEMAKQQMEVKDHSKAYHALEVISDNSSEMIQGMSDIVWTINPSNDSFTKLLQKLKQYASQITEPGRIKFTLTADESVPAEKLNMQQRRNIYLICKEAINNSVKYSHADEIKLVVKQNNSGIELLISDNGTGFNERIVNGNGLLNMELRAKEMGAHIKINSEINTGTTIKLLMKL